MEHNHSHNHKDGSGNISTAFFLNALFVIIELAGGIWTNSIAILSDALHDFGDCLSLAVAWALQKKSNRGRDEAYSYGYRRFSLLGSIFLSGVLSVSSVIVVIESIKRILEPQSVGAEGMLYLAIVGIIINGAAALRVNAGTSFNERAVFLHIMEDVLGWVAVFIVSIVMLFVELPMLDSLLSIAISIWVMHNVYNNIRGVFNVLLQRVPEGVNMEEIGKCIEALPYVESVHDIHIWSLDGERHIMSLHVVVNDVAKSRYVKESVRTLCNGYNIYHVTVEIETVGESCCNSCD